MKESTISNMTWNDVTVLQYLDIQTTIQMHSDALELMRHIIILLKGIDINQMNVSDAMALMDETNTFLSKPFIANKEFSKLTIDGKKCKVCDLSSMTLSQFMDYQELTKDPNNNLIELLALSIVPAGCKYNEGYDIDEFKEALKQAPVTTVYGVVNFLLAKLRSLYRSSLAYLTALIWLTKGKDKQMKKAMKTSLLMAYKSMGY